MNLHSMALASVLVAAALGACSSSGPTESSPVPSAGTSTSEVTSTTAATAPSVTTSAATPASGGMTSIGEALGVKIAYLALAKAATGISDEQRLEALATGVCQRIDANQTNTIGPWLKSDYNLSGDTAAKVAVVAIKYKCPANAAKIGVG